MNWKKKRAATKKIEDSKLDIDFWLADSLVRAATLPDD